MLTETHLTVFDKLDLALGRQLFVGLGGRARNHVLILKVDQSVTLTVSLATSALVVFCGSHLLATRASVHDVKTNWFSIADFPLAIKPIRLTLAVDNALVLLRGLVNRICNVLAAVRVDTHWSHRGCNFTARSNQESQRRPTSFIETRCTTLRLTFRQCVSLGLATAIGSLPCSDYVLTVSRSWSHLT